MCYLDICCVDRKIDCPPFQCDLNCEFGFDKDLKNECDICKCADPCKVSKQPYDTELYDRIYYFNVR